MTGVEIRLARKADAPGWAEQMKAVADEGRWIATESNRTVAELVERFHTATDEGHILLVLESDGRIVGGLGIHPTGIEGVHTLGMSILDEYRGQGWGRRLLDAGLAEARAQCVFKVVLEVWPDNGRAIALYTRAGFEFEGYKRNHYPRKDGSRRSALMMARFLETDG